MSAKKTQVELEELIGEADDVFSHSPRKENLKSLYEEALKKAKKLKKKVLIITLATSAF